MAENGRELYQRVLGFEFDEPGSELTFAVRLARDRSMICEQCLRHRRIKAAMAVPAVSRSAVAAVADAAAELVAVAVAGVAAAAAS